MIEADVSGGTIAINAQPFVNQSSLIGTGGTFSVSGLWDNRSGIVTVGATNRLVLTGGGRVWGGTLVATNGASLVISTCTFDGATVIGTLDVGNSVNEAVLTVTNGLVLNGTALVGNPTNSWYWRRSVLRGPRR